MAHAEISAAARAFLNKEHLQFIDGAWTASDDGGRIDVIDPADGSQVSSISKGGAGDIDRAVKAARGAFEDGRWREMKPAMRVEIIRKIADLMERDAETLALLETIDNGKPIKWSRGGDIPAAIGAFRYYAGWADKIHGQTHAINMPGEYHTYTLREPVGVAGLITPWNYPLVMAAMKLGPALAAGCACVLKPAEDTSLTSLYLADLMREAGVPDGVVNVVTGLGAEAGAALAAHDDVDKVAFTGSTATGKAIAAAATGNLKKVSLELGGKAPNIILPDADLDKAIAGSAMGVFFNSGQVCTAATRLYAHESVYEQVIEGVCAFAKNLKLAPGLDEDGDLGPLVSAKQLDRVSGYVDLGRKEGGDVVTGGGRMGETGYFFEPTVIANTTADMTVVREEIFGPVLAAQSFKDLDEVAASANNTTYGLSAVVWTNTLSDAHKMAKRLRAGNVGINTQMAADWDLPIGGFKQSGWGRENGYEGLSQYLETKAVVAAL